MNKKSKILIAGSTGLIGSAHKRRFEKDGYENLISISRCDLDLTNQMDVNCFFLEQKFDYVILAAGKVAGIIENKKYPADFIYNNLAIQLNTFEASKKTNVKKVIFFASSCMYPKLAPQPMSEDLLLSGKPEMTSISYALAKLAGLYSCLAYNTQMKRQIFIPLIPNSAYGPNDNFNPETAHVLSSLIARFANAKKNNLKSVTLWGSGEIKREFIHVDDIAEASIKLLNMSKLDKIPINIGTGIDIKINELAKIISDEIGFKGTISWDLDKPDGAKQKLLDSNKIKSYGWVPDISLTEGIKSTVNWYMQNYD